ncbi:hypothetical protein QBC34DRAFT_94252 [Podospora aff. communis PSN243]|uniref:Uncharacterized protein n=1 Tax=Podospora aff. communis PSN243 TaxID=3040156 RepID=A0AAV9GNA9_9PEZI|nr:hypothetical protein QBC34DRAFT_94252 [Podospora aff. communis PSN243]
MTASRVRARRFSLSSDASVCAEASCSASSHGYSTPYTSQLTCWSKQSRNWAVLSPICGRCLSLRRLLCLCDLVAFRAGGDSAVPKLRFAWIASVCQIRSSLPFLALEIESSRTSGNTLEEGFQMFHIHIRAPQTGSRSVIPCVFMRATSDRARPKRRWAAKKSRCCQSVLKLRLIPKTKASDAYQRHILHRNLRVCSGLFCEGGMFANTGSFPRLSRIWFGAVRSGTVSTRTRATNFQATNRL